MRNVGRLLTTLGWAWVILGIVGGAFGLEQFNIFPGFILLFVGRAIRRGAREQEPQGQEDEAVEAEAPKPRPLNTDRVVPPPAPRTESDPKVVVELPDEDERRDALEKILESGLAASAARDDRAAEDLALDFEEGVHGPISSAEMIERARKRWDRRD